jgi:Beta-ketoacyl synthase, N-terminal domain
MSAAPRIAYVDGIALWAPRLPGWEVARAVLRGTAQAPTVPMARSSPTLLPPNERRRAPDSVAVSLEVAGRACAAAGRDPRSLPSVFASCHGDLAVTDYMCETLAANPALLSPTKFHNSVHNAAAGYWTIATGCMERYTALSAAGCTFAEGLVEAFAQAACDATAVLYVAYDIQAQGPLATVAPSDGLLGAALVLAPEASERTQARIVWATREREAASDSAAPAQLASVVSGNAMAACLPLLAALAAAEAREVRYALGPGLALELRVCPVEA